MVSKIISKCGIDCGTCPWGPYPRKGMNHQDFKNYRKNAKRILGYMPIQTPCATCQTPNAAIPKKTKLPNRRCLIRQCVDKTGVRNCAYCSRFPCDTLKATSGLWTRKNIEKKLGEPISEKDYRVFVEPFEGIKHLNLIRDTLGSEQTVEPVKAPKSQRALFEFPEDLSVSNQTVASFKDVHSLLAALGQSNLGLSDTDTFAQYHTLENLKAHVLRFLWIFGSCGRFEKEERPHLVVDGRTYEANRGDQKMLAIWPFVRDTILNVLSQFGVYCERVVLNGMEEKDLVTGTGYMRREGWVMTLYFEEKIGGPPALKSLQEYVMILEKEYGKKAFENFRNANMQTLTRI